MFTRHRNATPAFLFLAALGLIAAAACGPGPVAEARSDLARNTAPDTAPEDLAAVAAGNNAFALDLYHRLSSGAGNLFYSPYSLTTALAMAYAGARGDTAQGMAAGLHWTLPPERLHPALNALDLALTAPVEDAAFTLRIANSLWGQENFTFLPEFLDPLALNYGAGLRLVDYQNEAARERARQAINAWVAQATEDTIRDLLAPGALTPDTRLVLANAIYFRGEWATPFNPDSYEAPFTLLSGETISVTTMSRRTVTPFVSGPGYQAIALPYQGGRAEMLIVIPDAGEFAAFEAALTPERLDEIAAALELGDVKVYLPRFQFETELSLKGALADLGLDAAFDPQRADFSGMTGEPDLFIADAVHKAFVAVDELGTEASAATGLTFEVVSMPREVYADRPFFFAIRDTSTGMLLFLGRVTDPR